MNKALDTLIRRQTRAAHPDGKFDKHLRWYPSENECRPCCRSIREPSAAYPYSLLAHCRTAKHVSRLFNMEEAELKQFYARYKKLVGEKPLRAPVLTPRRVPAGVRSDLSYEEYLELTKTRRAG